MATIFSVSSEMQLGTHSAAGYDAHSAYFALTFDTRQCKPALSRFISVAMPPYTGATGASVTTSVQTTTAQRTTAHSHVPAMAATRAKGLR